MIRLKTKMRIDEDLGFGKSPTTNNQRLLNRDGSSNVRRKGLPFFKPHEAYNSMIYMSWAKFWLIVFLFYFCINFIFGAIYLLIGMEHVNGANGGGILQQFTDAFFFSAQTVATVGYGHLSPKGFTTNLVAALESFIGLLSFALATGLLYGRFSRPTAKILYSDKILVSPYRDGEAYMFRLANLRSNQLIELEISVMLSINVLENDKPIRRFVQLELERKNINLLTLSWTVVHPLSENSPLYNLTSKELVESEAEFIVLLKSFDDAFSQTVHSRTSYRSEEVVFNAKFNNIIEHDVDGVFNIDISKVSDYTILSK